MSMTAAGRARGRSRPWALARPRRSVRLSNPATGSGTVSISLVVLTAAAAIQTIIFVATGSVALLADLIHNYGDGLTAIPLGIAFYLRSARGERWAGLGVVAAILISALVALYETIQRLVHPQHLSHLWVLAAAGVVGFFGNEIAARVRLRGGKRPR